MNQLSAENSERERFKWDKLFQYFLQGLLVIGPVAITAYSIYWIVSSIDSLIPIFTSTDEKGNVQVHNYGLGFLIVIVGICLVGYLSSFFIKLRLFSLFDSLLQRTPGIRLIYTSLKDFLKPLPEKKEI